MEDDWERPEGGAGEEEIRRGGEDTKPSEGAGLYLGAGIRACAAMRKRSMMKEQTRLELNISSLIWENWAKTQNTVSKTILLLQVFCGYLSSPCPPCGYL